jgi:predicted RNA-binding Zn-ribbon protein involved in translation (DUF1610 family)
MADKKETSKTESKGQKVKADNKVTIVKLVCPNCGAEEERLMYCDECDHPMNVEETEDRDLDSVENDITVSKESVDGGEVLDEEGATGNMEDPEVDDLIENGLVDIFPDDGESTGGSGDGSDMDLTDVLEALDNEE